MRATRSLRILVVDDNADVANGLAASLRAQQHEVEVAYDGKTAYEIVNHWCPQVALVDLTMPGIDGFELARRLRRKFFPQTLVLIAISGHAEDHRVREAGFDHYLLKPISLRMINEALTALLPP
jgi:CheY-like chemotaxis protein